MLRSAASIFPQRSRCHQQLAGLGAGGAKSLPRGGLEVVATATRARSRARKSSEGHGDKAPTSDLDKKWRKARVMGEILAHAPHYLRHCNSTQPYVALATLQSAQGF